MSGTIESLLEKLGMAFRSISLHSDGRWIAKGGHNFFHGKNPLVNGHTPLEALQKLYDKIKVQ